MLCSVFEMHSRTCLKYGKIFNKLRLLQMIKAYAAGYGQKLCYCSYVSQYGCDINQVCCLGGGNKISEISKEMFGDTTIDWLCN